MWPTPDDTVLLGGGRDVASNNGTKLDRVKVEQKRERNLTIKKNCFLIFVSPSGFEYYRDASGPSHLETSGYVQAIGFMFPYLPSRFGMRTESAS